MNTMMIRLFSLFAMTSVLFGATHAGDLEPPGPPAPTMVTLQDIFDKLDGMATGVPKTGQTLCWDTSGNVIACAGTGQDGEYQAGVSVDPRFTFNGDGTVTDNLTELIWLQDANCFGAQPWQAALDAANTLADGACGLTDGSVAGDWRLPNLRELHSLVDYSQSLPALPANHPFTQVQSVRYWSSTSTGSPHNAWDVVFTAGAVSFNLKTDSFWVWPVRSGR
jgi:hypothetical protein